MKVLIIGHYKETSGWGRACRDRINSLLSTGIEVVCRPINLGLANFKVSKEIKDCESKDLKDITHVIHNTFPTHYQYFGGAYNIGISFFETNNLKFSRVYYYSQLMDANWTPTLKYEIPKQKLIQQPIDTSIYKRAYPKISMKDMDYRHKFYYIGDTCSRKNISGIIKSYYNAFTPSDPVALILKLNEFGKNPKDLDNEISGVIDKIKGGLRLYPKEYYPPVKIITNYMTEEEIYSLHNYCDTYIAAAHGEGFCYPLMDAIGFGKGVIVNQGWINNENEISKSSEDIVYGQEHSFPGYNTSREVWNPMSNLELIKQMKQKPKTDNYDIEQNSYKTVGEKMLKELLCT